MKKEDKMLVTKFGNAKIGDDGYYIIRTGKYNGKRLHRLIFEDFYGKIPNGCVIHHKDGCKTNNCIMNLQLLTDKEHKRLHGKKYGKRLLEYAKKPCTETHRRNLSKSRNKTGYFNVSKKKNKTCKQGFMWRYLYLQNGKRYEIQRVNLDDLEKEVKNRGFKWEKFKEVEYIV